MMYVIQERCLLTLPPSKEKWLQKLFQVRKEHTILLQSQQLYLLNLKLLVLVYHQRKQRQLVIQLLLVSSH